MPVYTLQFTGPELVLLQAAILELPEKTRLLLQRKIHEQTAPKADDAGAGAKEG